MTIIISSDNMPHVKEIEPDFSEKLWSVMQSARRQDYTVEILHKSSEEELERAKQKLEKGEVY